MTFFIKAKVLPDLLVIQDLLVGPLIVHIHLQIVPLLTQDRHEILVNNSRNEVQKNYAEI